MSRGMIHDLLLRRPGQRIRDDEGRWRTLGDPTPFRGRIATRQASRADIAGGRGEQELAVVHIPIDIVGGLPKIGSAVVAEDLPEPDALLNGEWRIDSVVNARVHLRALCSRTDAPTGTPETIE